MLTPSLSQTQAQTQTFQPLIGESVWLPRVHSPDVTSLSIQIQSRLLRGGQVISDKSPPLYGLEPLVTYEKTDESSTTLDFKTVVTPGVIGSVVWDYRVEIVAGLKLDHGRGFLTVFCRDIPVIFTADPAGNMIGSLLGSMRRCDYLIRDNLNLPDHA